MQLSNKVNFKLNLVKDIGWAWAKFQGRVGRHNRVARKRVDKAELSMDMSQVDKLRRVAELSSVAKISSVGRDE